MLPKNKLRDRRLERLKIFDADHNPFEGNVMKRWQDGQVPGISIPPMFDVGTKTAQYRRIQR